MDLTSLGVTGYTCRAMKLTEAERIQLETETLLRHVVFKLRADGAALLKPRDEAPPLLVARTDLWPHDGCDQVAAIWRYSQRALLGGEPVRRGTLSVVPLFTRHSTKLAALLVCNGLPAEAPAQDQHTALFDLLVQEVTLGVAPEPKWDDLKAEIAQALPAGARNQIEAALREKIEETLAGTRGNVARAARRLGVPLRTLWNHIQRLQIDPAGFRVRLT